jgi:hypothetical protein
MSYDRYVFELGRVNYYGNSMIEGVYWIPCLMSHVSRKESVSNLPILSYKLTTITILSRHKSIRRTCRTAELCGIGIVPKKIVWPFIYMKYETNEQLAEICFSFKTKRNCKKNESQLRNMLQLSVERLTNTRKLMPGPLYIKSAN